jgi:hypothetical protein
MIPWSRFLAVEQVLQQVKAPGDWEIENLLHKPGTALVALVLALSFDFLDRDHRIQVLHEVNAAFFARPTLALLVMARGALKAQGGVAALAKSRNVSCLGTAFGAFHTPIL